MLIDSDPCCCAVSHISDLCLYEGCPEKAMRQFCDRHTINIYASNSYRVIGKKLNELNAFYIFTGVIEWIDKGEGDEVDEVDYAPQFEAYIRKHHLGVVVRGPARINRINHPEHVVRVYIWAPSQENLAAWWDKHK